MLSPAQPAIAASLAAWHKVVAARDLAALPELLHPNAVFRSPMAFKPCRPTRSRHRAEKKFLRDVETGTPIAS